ncbi:hypothetical protein QBC34DRAFT_103175 [Podospora aff. communis PSN243]|uniref:MYND-type domain-containing protein n=1 Tax=Podospora aff. communis PSN243 TaxID=3040156 RepID=A0AAV9H4D4_9PEZI|nr:hypothetical protein QBC34DRAFT_103175 [Podospora aff. communis PSN243]
MSQKFDWKEQGLDRAWFEALTKLLRLRHQGQVETPTRFDEDADDDGQVTSEMDCSSVKALPLMDFEANRLQRQFLDRLAELVANQKGGKHVAATAMSVFPDSVNVIVARNDGFRPIDKEFLERSQSLLRRIAATGQDDESKGALWTALLTHSESRIQGYLVDLRQLLKRYQQHCGTTLKPAQATVSALDLELRELSLAAFGQHPSTASRNDVLVTRAHTIHKMFSSEDFENLGFSASSGLKTATGYLGRLRTSFHTLIAAAERLEGFANIQITAIADKKAHGKRSKKAGSDATEPWSVARTFRQLGLPLTDDNVHTLLGSAGTKAKWSKAKLIQEFGKLRSPAWEVHAEMQLLQYSILNSPSSGRMFPYFGCSKRSCFLCWSFLGLHQGFKTRGCHGKLYNLWTLPSFEGSRPQEMSKIADTVRGLEALLTKELLNSNTDAMPLAKESTIGSSSIHTILPTFERPGLADTVLSYLDNQRLNTLFPATDNGGETEHEDTIEALSADNEAATSTDANSGPCGNFDCEKRTMRRCSRCHGRWYCSLSCEEANLYSHKFVCSRGAITTAEILQRDCYDDKLPEDPQVREDFGFIRCKNKKEESHLGGLYQGLFKALDVTAAEIHSWRMEGVLTEMIIEKFSTIPEKSRGGYYPWFLRNQQVLDESRKVVRDEDDPDLLVQQMLAKARPYLSPSDQNTRVEDLVPWAKQNCFIFLAILLDSSHPPPTMPNLDLWYDFGFAVCVNSHNESSLANFYMQLLLGNKLIRDYFSSLGSTHYMPSDFPTCSFEQFWKAWEAGTLMSLFDTYGSHGARASYGESLDFQFPDLREFLSYPGGHESDMKFPRPSVWRLRQFLATEGANVLTAAPMISRAAIEYGFNPELDTRTRLDLHAFWTKIFQRDVRTAAVDRALRRGILDEVADRWYGEPVNERVRAVLRAVSEAGRTVSAEAKQEPSDDDMHDMWKSPHVYDEAEELSEECSHTGEGHSNDDYSTAQGQSEPLGKGKETSGWCTVQ